MSWFDKLMNRTPRRDGHRRYRPSLETLENRQCPAGLAAPTGGLAAPTLLGLTAEGPSQVTLRWSDVSQSAGYHVLEWDGTQAITVATLAAHVTTTSVTGLPAGHRVWLSVEAFRDDAAAQSAWKSIELPVEPLTPASSLKATAVSSREIHLSWTDAEGETGYHVIQWRHGRNEVIATVAAGQHAAAVTELEPGQTYYFRVEAFNDSTAASTDWVTGTTLADPITAPTSLALTPTDTSVDLSWHAAQGADGYRIYEWDGSEAQLVGHTDQRTTTFSVTSLQPGTSYWFFVQAFNRSNSSSTPWKRVVTTNTAQPLLPPGDLTAHAGSDGQVELDWDTSHRAVGYRVYHWTGDTWEILASPDATATSATVTGLKTGSAHWFLVVAYTDSFNEFAASRIISVSL
jgi:hypothetical protein